MKRLLVFILVAAFAWSGLWVIGARSVKTGFATWFQERRDQGWHAEYQELSVLGFPNRLDTTFDQITLADPDTGLAWAAPFFQVFALTYKPNHLIAIWPHNHVLSTPTQKLSIQSTDMRASLVVAAGATIPLERSNLVIQDLKITSDAGWEGAAESFRVAVKKQEGSKARYQLAVEADGFTPPAALRPLGTTGLPKSFQTLRANITAEFSTPWDRFAIETKRPQLTTLNIKLAEGTWGHLHIQATGKLNVDITGLPTGNITVRARNWHDIIAVARQSGRINSTVLDAISKGLTLLSGLSGNPETLDIPLGFRKGMILIGPVPIGPAPRLLFR